jgi:hypothetical protein
MLQFLKPCNREAVKQGICGSYEAAANTASILWNKRYSRGYVVDSVARSCCLSCCFSTPPALGGAVKFCAVKAVLLILYITKSPRFRYELTKLAFFANKLVYTRTVLPPA